MPPMIAHTQYKKMVEAGHRRLAVYVEDKLFREAKMQALREGITLQQLVSVCLSERVIKGKKS